MPTNIPAGGPKTLAAKILAAKNWPLPRLVIADGTLEALKWIALLLMTGDHVNKYLLNGTSPALFAAGRIAMPLFVFVLAVNLARPEMLARGAYLRTMQRLAVFGVLAIPAFLTLGGPSATWFPLNILFTLLAITASLYLIEQGTARSNTAAALVFLIAGSNVEFWWLALALGLAVWHYCKQPSWTPIAFVLTSLSGLWFINGNLWALAAVPVVIASYFIRMDVPRLRWFFYGYYPLHLFALALIRIPMRKAGYLFF
jgi:TraX protein